MPPPSRAQPLPVLAVGLASGTVALSSAFRGPRSRFWQRMTVAAVGLSALAVAASPDPRRIRLRPSDAPVGLASAGVLYLAFAIGDRLARRLLPRGASEIRDIQALRELRPEREIAARLVLIGPAEEVFWRGFIQPALSERSGRWRGAALASAAYAGAHAPTGNLTLVAAAGVAGAYWTLLRALGVSLGALAISHAAWDVWIFLVRPTSGQPPVSFGDPR